MSNGIANTPPVKITPVILSGGSGTRLWPMSRAECPKQFLALSGDSPMFEQTLARTADPALFDAPVIVGNGSHAALMQGQLAAAGIAPASIILEPCARNTAPAIALAALAVGGGATPILVMPSDHVILGVPAFLAAVATALPAAMAGWLVTFGITPTGPETGYGYIRMGEALADAVGVRQAAQFIEKPDVAKAEALLASGDHAWNAGIFLFRADYYLNALSNHAPEMLVWAQAAFDDGVQDGVLLTPDAEAFAACPSDSIDYAVMEKADRVAIVPVSCGWSDLGSWDAIYDISDTDESGNAADGGAILIDSRNCLIRSEGVTVTAAGVDDLIIVAIPGHVMVVPRGHSQDVKKIVEEMKRRNK